MANCKNCGEEYHECEFENSQFTLVHRDVFKLGIELCIWRWQPVIEINLGKYSLVIGPHKVCSGCGLAVLSIEGMPEYENRT